MKAKGYRISDGLSFWFNNYITRGTAQKMKFSIKNFFPLRVSSVNVNHLNLEAVERKRKK